jgi:anti-anti-sigma factor
LFEGGEKVETMVIIIENEIARCVINVNLIASNIKAMVLTVKEELESREDFSQVIVDLSNLVNIDSMGITFIIGMHKTFAARGKVVKFTGVSDAMLQLFKIMKLDDVLQIETHQI